MAKGIELDSDQILFDVKESMLVCLIFEMKENIQIKNGSLNRRDMCTSLTTEEWSYV